MTKRIAIAGLFHETNTFAPGITRWSDFETGGGYLPLTRGGDMTQAFRGLNVATSGFLDASAGFGWEVVPLLWGCAAPGGRIESSAYDRLTDEILASLADAGPVDGVLLDMHGAMVAEHQEDGEGAFLAWLRALVGPDVPISISLDMHANVSSEMVRHADYITGFRTYPHVDIAENGARAARGLARLLAGEQLHVASRQIPYLIPMPWQYTGMAPAQGLFEHLETCERDEMVSPSLFFGFPAADVPFCGPSVLVYHPDQLVADQTADAITAAMLKVEGAFKGEVYSPEEAVERAMHLAQYMGRPIVIADAQDNPGAGGSSDTTGMLRALVEAKAERAVLGLMHDPVVAAKAHKAGAGAVLDTELGGRSGIAGDHPFVGQFEVIKLTDGKVIADGAFYQGAHVSLGPSAVLRIGGVDVLVSTNRVHLVDPAFHRHFGIEPEKQAVLVNKSAVHFRLDFEPIAGAILFARSPGAMVIDPAELPWTRLPDHVRRRPLGPTAGEMASK